MNAQYYEGQKVSYAGLHGVVRKVRLPKALQRYYGDELTSKVEADLGCVEVTFGEAARHTVGEGSPFFCWPYIKFTVKGQLLEYPFGEAVLMSEEGCERAVDASWEKFR